MNKIMISMLYKIKCSRFFFVFHILLILFYFDFCCAQLVKINRNSDETRLLPVRIDVVLDPKSSLDNMVNLCMDMAISDWYSANPNYETRLRLHEKEAKSVLDVNVAVLELVKHEKVSGILGPQGSRAERFAAAIAETYRVPIISLAATSSGLPYSENRYFVSTTWDDAVRAEGLAAICQRFEWPEVVILYEDTEYGTRFVSHLIKAFQDVDIEPAYKTPIPTTSEDSHILKQLTKLNNNRMRVFLVHMNPLLGSRLFFLANSAGMMRKGYAWMISDSLSIFLNSIDSDVRDSMDGVLGIRPYLFASKMLKSFQERWRRNVLLNKTRGPIMELNIHGLWAYDAVTALAIAIENIRPVNSNGTDNTGFRNSSLGSRLLTELYSTKFRGLAGDFELVEGKLKASVFEIFNINGNGERRLGFWTPERGIVRELSNSTSTVQLKNVVWPGDSVIQPKPVAVLTTDVLRVGVPWKPGFKQFVNVVTDPAKNHTDVTGFCIDIFLGALNVLPFPINYEFHVYNDSTSNHWSYDDMLHKIPQEYDMVVADTTIWAPRAEYVDFSQPYSESGVVLIVKNKKPSNMWIFVEPLRWDLWLAIIVSCVLLGLALRILERRHTERHGTTYWLPIAFLAFPERNRISNSCSVFVLVCWMFMAFILMQSFTANLSAILTVDQLKFTFSDDYYIGYHEGSFMKQFLTDQLRIRESRLRPYISVEEFHDAMSKGSENGGIDAIFDEIPYMKIFLNRYTSRYKMVGPTYRTGGMGFAFPVGSRLVANFSRAIVNVTQGPEMNSWELRNFGPGYSSQDPLSSVISQGTSSLTPYEFGGLFIIIASLVALAIIYSERAVITHFFGNWFCFRAEDVPSEEGSHVYEGVALAGMYGRGDEDNGDVPPQPREEQLFRHPASSIGVDNEVDAV